VGNLVGKLGKKLKAPKKSKYAPSSIPSPIDLLDIPESLERAGGSLQDMAHGFSPLHGGSLQTGSIDPRLLDVLNLAPAVGPTISAAKSIGLKGLEAAHEGITYGRGPMAYMQQYAPSVVKNEGGNWFASPTPELNELLTLFHGGRKFDKWNPKMIGMGEGGGRRSNLSLANGPGLYAGDTPLLAKMFLKYGGENPALSKLLVDDTNIIYTNKKLSEEMAEKVKEASSRMDKLGMGATRNGLQAAFLSGVPYDRQVVRDILVDSGIDGVKQNLHNVFGHEYALYNPDIIKAIEQVDPEKFKNGGRVVGHENQYVKKAGDFSRKSQQWAAGMIPGLQPIITDANQPYYPRDTDHNGAGDAMRHLLLQAGLVDKYGEVPARLIGWLHEMSSPGQPDAEYDMDAHNDGLGRQLGGLGLTKEELVKRAKSLIDSGTARTIPQGEDGYKDGGGVDTDKANFRLSEPQGNSIAAIIQQIKDIGNPNVMKNAKPITEEEAMNVALGAITVTKGDILERLGGLVNGSLKKVSPPELGVLKRKMREPTLNMRNHGIRYEVPKLPRYQENVHHYDVGSGAAVPDIIKLRPQFIAEETEFGINNYPRHVSDKKEMLSQFQEGQIRTGNIRHLTPENAEWYHMDPWEAGGSYSIRDKALFYPNVLEGSTITREIPKNLSIQEILSSPELRKELNMSLAVPTGHPFHKTSKVYKKEGGGVSVLDQVKQLFDPEYMKQIEDTTLADTKDIGMASITGAGREGTLALVQKMKLKEAIRQQIEAADLAAYVAKRGNSRYYIAPEDQMARIAAEWAKQGL
jgi:hypothetical protein